VEEDLAWGFVGQDPTDLERIVERVRTRTYQSLGGRELASQVLGAIEIALWDLRGKVLGQPVSRLLGRHHDRLPIYAAGKPALSADADWHVDFVRPLLDQGAAAAKVRPGRGVEWDAKFLRRVRELLSDVDLLVDGKYNYYPDSALRLARVLDEIGAHCFEEPIIDDDLAQVAWLAASSPVPLAYGEHAFGLGGFTELADRGGVRILEPDVTVCGGFGQYRSIVAMAHARGLEVVPHCGGLTVVGMAANLHAAATIIRRPLFEYDARAFQPLRDLPDPRAPLAPASLREGTISVPDGPGLGIEIDESVFNRFAYEVDETLARSFTVYGTPHL
jgi:L-alanine-DL-glutamate epimerase-like enolase superfamily enzyme